jgi:multidrug efflux system outer membrane protein
MRSALRATGLASAVVIAACVAIPPAAVVVAPHTADTVAIPAMLPDGRWPDAQWWQRYDDAQLDALVLQSLATAPDLDAAGARVRSAEAAFALARSALGPSLDANASLDRERFSEHGIVPPPFAGSWFTLGRSTLDFSYGFDFWGKNRAALAAAVGQQRAAVAEHAEAERILAAAVVQTYFRYQADAARLVVAREVLAVRRDIARLTASRVDQGLDAIGAQREAEGNAALAQRDVIVVETDQRVAREELRALSGAGPDALADLRDMPVPKLTSGVPPLGLDLIARRPDIIASQWRVEAASHDIDSATAQFYPDVNIVAFIGLSSTVLGQFFAKGSYIAGVTPAFHLPLFESGKIKANLAASRAASDLAIAQYNQTIVAAVRDVAEQAATLQGLDREQQAVSVALGKAQGGRASVIERLDRGLADEPARLMAELNVLAQRDNAVDVQGRLAIGDVALIKALGGGYRSETSVPVASSPAAQRTQP